MELLSTVDVYPVCDRCFNGVREPIYLEQEREVIGGDGAMCAVMLCESCWERMGKPPIWQPDRDTGCL